MYRNVLRGEVAVDHAVAQLPRGDVQRVGVPACDIRLHALH